MDCPISADVEFYGAHDDALPFSPPPTIDTEIPSPFFLTLDAPGGRLLLGLVAAAGAATAVSQAPTLP